MKVVKKESKNQFKPFKIEVEIESIDELVELYHRLNVGSVGLKHYTQNLPQVRYPDSWGYCLSLYNELSEELVKLGVKS